MVFLGLDERVKDAFKYEHKGAPVQGAPYFALDVTPRGSVKENCEKLLAEMEKKGLVFTPGRGMELVAGDGKFDFESAGLVEPTLAPGVLYHTLPFQPVPCPQY